MNSVHGARRSTVPVALRPARVPAARRSQLVRGTQGQGTDEGEVKIVSLTLGTKLGPYEILAPLGAGGMGEVFRARDTRLDRDVAIKVLSDAMTKALVGEGQRSSLTQDERRESLSHDAQKESLLSPAEAKPRYNPRFHEPSSMDSATPMGRGPGRTGNCRLCVPLGLRRLEGI
jgi:serine/threonine protein kinase